MSTINLTITKELSAPPDVVFEAWTTAESMAQWISPMPLGATIPKFDLRVGGEYQIDMHSEDRNFVHVGKFLKIDKPRALDFTWISDGTEQKETIVRLQFESKGEGTLLTLTHEDFTSEEAKKNHNQGWTVIVDKLASALVSA